MLSRLYLDSLLRYRKLCAFRVCSLPIPSTNLPFTCYSPSDNPSVSPGLQLESHKTRKKLSTVSLESPPFQQTKPPTSSQASTQNNIKFTIIHSVCASKQLVLLVNLIHSFCASKRLVLLVHRLPGIITTPRLLPQNSDFKEDAHRATTTQRCLSHSRLSVS